MISAYTSSRSSTTEHADRNSTSSTIPETNAEKANIRSLYKEAATTLLKEGAVFTRPYGDLAPIVYERAASYATHLKRLKKIFDPNNIMNPSNLCF